MAPRTPAEVIRDGLERIANDEAEAERARETADEIHREWNNARAWEAELRAQGHNPLTERGRTTRTRHMSRVEIPKEKWMEGMRRTEAGPEVLAATLILTDESWGGEESLRNETHGDMDNPGERAKFERSIKGLGGAGSARQDFMEDIRDTFVMSDGAVPASDRIVRLDHNSADYRTAVGKVEETREKVRGTLRESNNEEVAGGLARDDVERVGQELGAGLELLKGLTVRIGALTESLVKALKWLGEKAGTAAVGLLATAAIAALAKMLGIPL